MANFLPTCREEIQRLGWDCADIVLVTADAYVDHPSFGVALIGRYLEKLGYRVAVLAQPDWRSAKAFISIGRPYLFWGITSGAVDSQLNNYASLGHRRGRDVYSPGGKTGMRPDRPLQAYAARAREAFKGVPIILGGLEASGRRLVHYDYISDKLKKSILFESKADLLVYGMAERAICEIANRLAGGEMIPQLVDIAGTAYPATQGRSVPAEVVSLPSFGEQNADSGEIMLAHMEYQRQSHAGGKSVVQEQDPGKVVVLPPAQPLSTAEMDDLYDLPFTRKWHDCYEKAGGVPALEPVRFSLTTHRGCFGGCSFCSIYFHQGKHISSRSVDSLLREAESCREHKDFRGTISDIGGPTANMYGMSCGGDGSESCERVSCVFPRRCRHLRGEVGSLMTMMESFVSWAKRSGKKANIYVATANG